MSLLIGSQSKAAASTKGAQTQAAEKKQAKHSHAKIDGVSFERSGLLSLGEELDAGTCFALATPLRKIIGGYCGIVFQQNLSTFG